VIHLAVLWPLGAVAALLVGAAYALSAEPNSDPQPDPLEEAIPACENSSATCDMYPAVETKAEEIMFPVEPEPLVVNCEVKTTGLSAKLSDGMTRSARSSYGWNLDTETASLIKATGKVWIYNVSRISHVVTHPFIETKVIPANTTKKRYTLWTSLPDIITTWRGDLDSLEITPHPVRGARIAMDIINPDNLSLDQDLEVIGLTSIGRNLGERGVFWSYSNPPKKVEVDAAVARMEKHYLNLLEKLKALENTDPRALSAYITAEAHAAAEHFNYHPSWQPMTGSVAEIINKNKR